MRKFVTLGLAFYLGMSLSVAVNAAENVTPVSDAGTETVQELPEDALQTEKEQEAEASIEEIQKEIEKNEIDS